MDRYQSKSLNKKPLPINLLRKAQREERNKNALPKKKPKKVHRKKDFHLLEHEAMVHSTEAELREILQTDDILSDIPYDCTPEELLGEIALAKREALTVYVQRDGLSTLRIVLPQQNPTIANLRRAIEVISRVQLRREQHQQYESQIAESRERQCQQQNNDPQQVVAGATKLPAVVEPYKSTGELVCSVARNGHHHRSNVSWRFLWRVYALFHLDTNTPINDENGRQLLSKCGIEDGTTLKFCKREKYFGRKRQ